MEDMRQFDEQMPCVGIFWYDPGEDTLPYFEFVYDYHWDIGHGWSGDMK